MKSLKRKKARTGKYYLPSFLKGFASAFDITGQTLLELPDLNAGFLQDAEALRNDWLCVGNDIRTTMNHFAHINRATTE